MKEETPNTSTIITAIASSGHRNILLPSLLDSVFSLLQCLLVFLSQGCFCP